MRIKDDYYLKKVKSIRKVKQLISRRKSRISRKKMNKEIKIKNGNIIKNGIKIIQWNKGSSAILNKINEIRDIIEKKRPEIFIINEFNLEENIIKESINIKGYQIELDDLIEDGMARTAIYIRNNIN